jgi:L-alanine-DL-glutamate epimerase-like enolase superfamily enzyme
VKNFTYTTESWPIAGTFTIARGSKTSAEVIVVTVTENGTTGRGEAVPYPRYNETVQQCLDALHAGHKNLPKAAANALDCALWDLRAKQSDTPAWQLANLQAPKPVVTAYTLSLDTPEAMAKNAMSAAARPLLKLKLGREGDVERLQAIREAVPNATLIVDANEGWTTQNLSAMLAACEKYKVELVEQPLPAHDDEALRGMPRNTIICADESAHGIASLQDLKGKYDAINIKLDKTGGLTKALQLAHAAKQQDFKIMVGCMLATSLAMAPAFLLAQMADYVDLDGPLLLAKDRSPGFTFEGSLMLPPPRELWG